MATEYDVQARLTMDARQASRATSNYSNQLVGLGRRIRGTQGAMGGLVGKAVALGATYVGLSAGISVFSRLTKSALSYTAELESTKIGLSSVLSAVNDLSYSAAKLQADEAFNKIKELSITSPVGPRQMFQIFKGIVGPVRSAGKSMDVVYTMTKNSVLAANALGVDLEQASRDMQLMARGTAGMDTRMFAIMRSMGLITESTEEWNKELSAAERAERLNEILKGFAPAGKEFARSFAGVVSTFGGLWDEITRIFMSPILDKFTARLAKLNDYIINNNAAFMATMSSWGQTVASVLESVVDKGMSAFEYLQSNWGTITEKWNSAMRLFEKYGPLMAKVAAGVAAVNLAQAPAGAAVTGVGMAAGGVMQAGGMLAGAGQGIKAGAQSAKAGALSALGIAGTTMGGGGGGVAAAGAAAAASLGPLIAALGVLASIGVAVYENIYLLTDVFDNLMAYASPLIGDIKELAGIMWNALKPILELVGLIIVGTLIVAFKTLVNILEYVVIPPMKVLWTVLGWIAEQIDLYVVPAFQKLIGWLGDVAAKAEDPSGHNIDYSKYGTMKSGPQVGVYSSATAEPATGGKDTQGRTTPKARSGTQINVDKMIVKQEFKGEKDPDRVVSMMMNDITKQAERRVSTRYTGALTR